MQYPVGIQDFRELREGGYVYVDKTEHIHRIVTGGKYFFLSRPRRFGKSLLLSTMKELYSGSRELFEGLWIENNWKWDNVNPVIHLKFASISYQTNPLDEAVREYLFEIAKQLKLEIALSEDTKKVFQQLIISARETYERKPVLLIYDKPIIDYLDDVPQAEANRDVLKNFYSILKDSDPYLELVFITGVSAFSKVSIFSDLNNLENLSLSTSAFTLFGLETEDHIYVLEFKLDQTAEEAIGQIREKGYLEPYAGSPKEKIAVGVNFSSKEKKVSEALIAFPGGEQGWRAQPVI